jgi:DNA-binding XRE family transcriptional regulator
MQKNRHLNVTGFFVSLAAVANLFYTMAFIPNWNYYFRSKVCPMPGTIIKKIRKMKMLKQETVAKEMGISQAAYSKIENNITELTVSHCKMLSRIFGVNVYDFLDDDFEIIRPNKNSQKPG